MKEKRSVVVLLAALVVLLVGAGLLYHRYSAALAPDPVAQSEGADRVPAPDFTVYDGEGNAVQLSDFLGKPVVVNFWASWCGPCKNEMPEFNEVWEELEGEVQFLMVNVTDGQQETVDSASSYVESQGYTFPVFYDTTLQAALTYQAFSLPTTFFIDENGAGVAKATGSITKSQLQQGIEMIYTP